MIKSAEGSFKCNNQITRCSKKFSLIFVVPKSSSRVIFTLLQWTISATIETDVTTKFVYLFIHLIPSLSSGVETAGNNRHPYGSIVIFSFLLTSSSSLSIIYYCYHQSCTWTFSDSFPNQYFFFLLSSLTFPCQFSQFFLTPSTNDFSPRNLPPNFYDLSHLER